MTDLKRLRELAMRVKGDRWRVAASDDIRVMADPSLVAEWSVATSPQTVLALLDALEAEQRDAKRYRLAREGRYPDFAICRRDPENDLCVQFLTGADADAAIDAIAEQEERT